jgi:hypothetical protein
MMPGRVMKSRKSRLLQGFFIAAKIQNSGEASPGLQQRRA